MTVVGISICVLVAVLTHQAHADLNFGKKVPCSIIAGTVVCPGCPARAGMSCPKRPRIKPQWDSCLPSPPEVSSTTTKITTPRAITAVDEISNKINITETSTFLPPPIYRKKQHPYDYVPGYFLYLFRRNPPIYHRLRRAIEDDQGEVCSWNADCPCPLICCKQGEGCPRKCMQGIRLPPPY
uniref:U42-Liphistoxin-Lth1a_1 n=1 Tax=Liphistius thaleban TaxID=1905330 RepID=A0A4V2H8N1_9ARAC